MAGIRLEWAQFGDFDSFDVIRSDAPMDINALPSPIATNLSTMYYVDTAIVEGATYYYRVVAWRDGASKVSWEIAIVAMLDSNASAATSLLNFENGFTDKKGLIWTASGDATATNTQAKFGSYSLSSTSGGLSTPDSAALRPGTGDYTVAFWYRPNVLTNWHTVFNKGYWNAAGGLALIIGGGSIKVSSNTSDSGDISHGMTANQWTFIELSRVNGEAYLFTNGILRRKFAQTQNLNSTLPLALMSGGGIVGGASGFLDEFRYVIGQGWHTENYDPPITPF